eukprot:c19864_g3_i1 orf=67-1554(+)
MVGVFGKNKLSSGPVDLQECRPQSEVESGKVLTQRAVILILMVMVLLPFVLARVFISHITFLPTVQYTEPPSTSSTPTMPLSTSTSSSSATASSLNPVSYDHQQEIERQRQEDEDHRRQVEDHHQQEGHDEVNFRKPDEQQEQDEFADPIQLIDFSVGGCNIWKGKWIPHHMKPAYTNMTCKFIQGHQNCLSNGRPDHQYLQWRWKPHDCELPLFDAKIFLKLVHGKAWAFVGDSISRNHFQSFLCFLAQVELPENLYRDEKDLFVRWFFPSYNFTLAVFWSPFLVQWTEDGVKGFPAGTEKLHLDTLDENWISSIPDYDYVVLSAGHWFLKSSIYFKNNEVIGCHYSPGTNCTQLGFYFAFRTALRTVYDSLASSSYRGTVFFRTFTPDHFENGQWHNGGSCTRTTPVHNATLGGVTEEMYKIQLEEFGRALRLNSDMHSRLKIVDTIHSSLVRVDGHPGPYRNVGSSANDLPQDCLHWCLPGPIDTWSAMLLE